MCGEIERVVSAVSNRLNVSWAMPVPVTVEERTGTCEVTFISATPLSFVAASGSSRIDTLALSWSALSIAGMFPIRSRSARSVTPGVSTGTIENVLSVGLGRMVLWPNVVRPPPTVRPVGSSSRASSTPRSNFSVARISTTVALMRTCGRRWSSRRMIDSRVL